MSVCERANASLPDSSRLTFFFHSQFSTELLFSFPFPFYMDMMMVFVSMRIGRPLLHYWQCALSHDLPLSSRSLCSYDIFTLIWCYFQLMPFYAANQNTHTPKKNPRHKQFIVGNPVEFICVVVRSWCCSFGPICFSFSLSTIPALLMQHAGFLCSLLLLFWCRPNEENTNRKVRDKQREKEITFFFLFFKWNGMKWIESKRLHDCTRTLQTRH